MYVLLWVCHDKAEGGAIWNKAGTFGSYFVIVFFQVIGKTFVSLQIGLGFFVFEWFSFFTVQIDVNQRGVVQVALILGLVCLPLNLGLVGNGALPDAA